MSAVVARRLFAGAVSRLPVSVVVLGPDGHRQLLGQGGPAMTVSRPDEFFARLGRDGLIGFGESYLTGAWDAEDLAGFLTVLAADLPTLVPASLQKARALVVARPPHTHRSTATNSRGNIAHHYDLSNELFATFLDPTMSYSSALFDTPVREYGEHLVAIPPGGEAATEPLAEAQGRKFDRLLDRDRGRRRHPPARDRDRLGRAGHPGRTPRGAGPQRHALHRAARARPPADRRGRRRRRVQVDLLDYRSIQEMAAYDAIVSVEMIEAVGHDFWPEYFQTLDRVLAPGGRIGLQAIVMPHDRMLATRNTYTWINKYIFPGGFLPSVTAVEQVTRDHTTLRVTERLSFGSHYAETLRRWDAAFAAAHERVRELGFDETFARMWHFYLGYSRAGFASGYLDVEQIVLER